MVASTAWMPGPDRKSGPVRINYVVRIFRSGFSWSGPWSGFFGPDFFGPVRGTDFLVRIFWSRFFRSGPWYGFSGPDFLGPVRGPDFSIRIFTGPVRGPDFLVRIIRTGPDFFVVRSVVRIFFFKIKKSGPDQFRLRNFGPVRILVRIFQ